MGDTYEVLYFDPQRGYIPVTHVHWWWQAWRLARKLNKTWPCVQINRRV